MSGTEPIPPETTVRFKTTVNASGIVNENSPNRGNQAAGSHNHIDQHTVRAAPVARPDMVTATDLIVAIRTVQSSLHQHCADQPGAVPEQVAGKALAALDRAADEASKPKAEARTVGQWLSFAIATLGDVSGVAGALADAIAALQSMCRQLFGG